MKYFEYFSCKEFFPNCSTFEVFQCVKFGFLDNLLHLVDMLNQFRDELGYPIVITSSFRDFAHNKRVGGSGTSQHMSGSAIDFKCDKVPFVTFYLLFQDFVKRCGFDKYLGQVIIYHKSEFIHAALSTPQHNHLIYLHYEQRES